MYHEKSSCSKSDFAAILLSVYFDCLDLKSKSDLDCVQNEWANVCFGKIDKKTFRTFVSEKLQSTKNFWWVFTKYFYKHLVFILMGRAAYDKRYYLVLGQSFALRCTYDHF
jgi:hypothetical protein